MILTVTITVGITGCERASAGLYRLDAVVCFQ
jgi:hypothetical protein